MLFFLIFNTFAYSIGLFFLKNGKLKWINTIKLDIAMIVVIIYTIIISIFMIPSIVNLSELKNFGEFFSIELFILYFLGILILNSVGILIIFRIYIENKINNS